MRVNINQDVINAQNTHTNNFSADRSSGLEINPRARSFKEMLRRSEQLIHV